ncbi:MAG: hypothetical protein IRY95_01945 [Clostridia bacterium]|nr:hypothetical protein [Clostridia bacterium]
MHRYRLYRARRQRAAERRARWRRRVVRRMRHGPAWWPLAALFALVVAATLVRAAFR